MIYKAGGLEQFGRQMRYEIRFDNKINLGIIEKRTV